MADVPPEEPLPATMDIPKQTLGVLRELWNELEQARQVVATTDRHMKMLMKGVATAMGIDLNAPGEWNIDLPTGKLTRKPPSKEMH